MKKVFALPVLGLFLGALAIAMTDKKDQILDPGLSVPVMKCIQTAIAKRETNITNATSVYQTASLSALTAKKSILLASRDKTTKKDIKAGTSQAWKNYKDTVSVAKDSFRASKSKIRTTYAVDVKNCKGSLLVKEVDSSNETSDDD